MNRQRHVEHLAAEHVKQVVAALEELARSRQISRLAVGGSEAAARLFRD